jgi:hypothetical protein
MLPLFPDRRHLRVFYETGTAPAPPAPRWGRLLDRAHRHLLKERPDIGAAVTASPAGKLGLEIGQPDIIGPAASLDHDRMRTVIIAAVDEPGRAGLAHFPDGDFLFAWHGGVRSR